MKRQQRLFGDSARFSGFGHGTLNPQRHCFDVGGMVVKIRHDAQGRQDPLPTQGGKEPVQTTAVVVAEYCGNMGRTII